MNLLCLFGHRFKGYQYKFGPAGLFQCTRCARRFLMKLPGTEFEGARSPWDGHAKAMIAAIYPDLWLELPQEVRDA